MIRVYIIATVGRISLLASEIRRQYLSPCFVHHLELFIKMSYKLLDWFFSYLNTPKVITYLYCMYMEGFAN